MLGKGGLCSKLKPAAKCGAGKTKLECLTTMLRKSGKSLDKPQRTKERIKLVCKCKSWLVSSWKLGPILGFICGKLVDETGANNQVDC